MSSECETYDEREKDGVIYLKPQICDEHWLTHPHRIDCEFTKTLSFVPEPHQIDHIVKLFQKNTGNGETPPEPKNAFTEEMFLGNAPWIRFKTGAMSDVKNEAFAFIRDGASVDEKFPLTHGKKGPTMGTNGVLIKFDTEYGEKRYNLFSVYDKGDYMQKKGVHEMLRDFLTFRDKNAMAILAQSVSHMMEQNFNDEKYSLVTEMFKKCTAADSFEETGLALESFCQTYDVEGAHDSNFSIAAPHFQTRIRVGDAGKLYAFLRKNGRVGSMSDVKQYFLAYKSVVQGLVNAFEKWGYTKKFVHLDALCAQMSSVAAVEFFFSNLGFHRV